MKNLKNYLEKAGYSIDDETKVSKMIVRAGIFVNILITIYLFYTGYYRGDSFLELLPTLIGVWTVLLFAIILGLWILFYFFVDLRIFKRRLDIEEVLPDFLMLTSSNINAGMPIDQALCYAVRPRFGILAKEIEEVAKRTLVGDELKEALLEFTKKYDSLVLQRSINLLLEGVDSGGKIADIINKIALDIQNTRTFKKEMAANVTTYVIFISFATVAAAPFLFALSKQLLIIIKSIMGGINFEGTGAGFSFDASAISVADYNVFAIFTLSMTSVFSAMIISIIKKGNIKEGLNYIPAFVVTNIVIYLIATKLLDIMLGGLF
ncbi:hypothetical protein C0585_07845 [Candidatus Woesearchaeota archaeon]|nr:MAG: hypothetical protein C0585_07845 [Candidatus Woesearchaeota archaeon]